MAAGNPAAAGGSCRRRPGSSGPRLARCCSRESLLGTGEEGEARSSLPGPSAPPMYTSLGSGPVAALPASGPPSPLRSWSYGGRRGCVPQEGKRPGCVRASGHGTSVWQVSEAASIGVSSSPLLGTLVVLGPIAALLSPRPTPSPPRAPLQASSWPLASQVLHSHSGWGSWGLPPSAPFLAPEEASPGQAVSPRWVGGSSAPPILVASSSSSFPSSCFL